jgi:hypothetical protein
VLLRVPEALGEPVGEGVCEVLGERLALGVPDWLRVPVGDADPVCEPVLAAEPEADVDGVSVTLRVDSELGVPVTLALSVAEGVCVVEGVEDELGEPCWLGDTVALDVAEGVTPCDELGDCENVAEVLPVTEGDASWLGVGVMEGVGLVSCVALRVDEALEVPVPLTVTAELVLCVTERVPVSLRVAVSEGVTDIVLVTDGV